MALPFFYKEDIKTNTEHWEIDEQTSKYIVQVLRMQIGEQLHLTDGKGNIILTQLINDNRKKCEVKFLSSSFVPQPNKQTTIAISLLKNTQRFEWFIEKATEIGVTEIIPLLCERTERQHFRYDRLKSILVSAMLQSQQAWIPVLHNPAKFTDVLKSTHEQKFIAHCEKDKDKIHLSACKPFTSSRILIGPEGDFTKEEIDLAVQQNFIPVTLGTTRLRTETAGIVSATILSNPVGGL